LMNDGDTIVIGGLLKDVKIKTRQGVPFLSKIPFLGLLFSRETYDMAKMDLLIFITANIIKDNDFSQEEITRIEKSMEIDGTGKGPAKEP